MSEAGKTGLGWIACLVVGLAAASGHGETITRGPYLQLGTPTSLVVRWRTDVPSTSIVRYGYESNRLDQSVTDAGVTTEHIVWVRHLTPDTKYYYGVGSTNQLLAGAKEPFAFVTSPVPGAAKPTRVWVLGDSGTKDARPRAVRDAYAKFTGARRTDLWLMLGDNAYSYGKDEEYQRAVFEMYPALLRASVLWPTLGNHDARSARSKTQSGVYYDIFTLPTMGEAGGVASGTEAYYAFDYGNLHFICLDSAASDRTPTGPMLSWLKRDLAGSRRDWIIAFWHHPPYSKGSHDSDRDSGRMRQMREHALPILEAGGVDLVLSGHSHSYERSYLLDGHYGRSTDLAPRRKKNAGDGRAGGDGAYRKPTLGPGPHEGAVYVVAGSSGQTSGGKLNYPGMFISLNRLGSLVLDINGPRLDAVFVDSQGTTRDWFTILKGNTLGGP